MSKPDQKSKNDADRGLTGGLELSFRASDPPAGTRPGSGDITGPEAPSCNAYVDNGARPS